MKPIAIFYHCLFFLGDANKPLPWGREIIAQQMGALESSGLLEAAARLVVGINGGAESYPVAHELIPGYAVKLFHGLQTRNELRTLLALESWAKQNPGWHVLYFHSKGATHPKDDPYSDFVTSWRNSMMETCVANWQRCVADLQSGFESVGRQWMSGPGMPNGQSIWAGNFFWATSDYLATLPSMMERERLLVSGIDSLESRYEAEVWIGNGARLPRVKDYLVTT